MARKEKRPTFDDAHESFQEGDYEAALQICDEIIGEDEAGAPADVLWLAGESLLQLQEPQEALHLFDLADERDPEQPAILLGRGVACFELLRWADAETALRAAIDVDEEVGDAWYYLGLIAERRGDDDGATQSFARAVAADPENLHAPTDWSSDAVSEAWGRIRDDLPDFAKSWFEGIQLSVHKLPEERVLRVEDGNISPLVHCLYFGEHGAEPEGMDPASWFRHPPPRVELYSRNLGKSAHDTFDLEQEVFEAFLWETIEFLGLNDEQSQALGTLLAGGDDEES